MSFGLLADTGFFVALASASDKHHAAAVAALRDSKEPLITTWPVLTETCHLMLRAGVDAQLRFMRAVASGAIRIFNLRAEHLPRIEALMIKYRDLPMDLADASLVIAAEDRGDGRILSTDMRDFGAYRWKNRKPFTNLLAPRASRKR